MNEVVLLLLVVVVALYVFGPLTSSGFTGDDYVILRLVEFGTINPLQGNSVPNVGLLDLLFLKPLEVFSLYRPLVLVSFALCAEMFGMQPLGHVLVTLFLHIINSVLVFVVLNRLWPRHVAACLIGAAVFAFHPIQVQVAAWSSARSDSLLFLFGLSAVILKWKSPTRVILPALLFFFSLLCKESALIWIVPLILLDLRSVQLGDFPGPIWKSLPWRRLLLLMFVVVLFLVLRWAALSERMGLPTVVPA